MLDRARRPGSSAWIGVLAVWLAAATVAAAQIASGSLVGDVVDEAGAAVPGATVTATATATGVSRTTSTNADGRYVVAGLPPGGYAVRVELTGFGPAVREGIALQTGQTLRVDVPLRVGGRSEAVTVSGAPPLLRSETSGLGHVIDQRRVVDLPLNGRSFIALASLAPGVAVPPPPAAPLPRINGGRPRTNEYLFDGISVLQPEPGQVAFFPNVDAIQEFTIESNSPPAEFGRFNGGVVNLTTKSGQNDLHGSVFEFARHEDLNARNFFASGTATKPRFRRHQFGGVAGGPIRKGATFFFVDYQGQRQTIGRTVISTVPTVLQRQGVFTEAIGGRVPVIYDPATTTSAGGAATRTAFPGNTIPDARIDPVARRLLERYPLPTGPGTANNYRRVGRRARRPGPGQRPRRSPPAQRRRSAVRARDALRRDVPAGHAPAGRQRRRRAARWVRSGHAPGRPRRATSTSSPSAGCTSCGSAIRGAASIARRPRWTARPGRASACPAFRRPRRLPTRCRHSWSPATSSSARRRTPRPSSAPA